MSNIISLINSVGQRLDSLVRGDGGRRYKLGVGSRATGLTDQAAWQGVATHEDGEAFTASDGVVALAGVDTTGSPVVRKFLVDASGRPYVVVVPTQGSVTDRSGSVAAGGTSQVLAASSATRKYLFIQNLHASEDLWFNYGTAAVADQPSIRLEAGQSYESPPQFVSTQSVNVIAATTGHKFTAKEA